MTLTAEYTIPSRATGGLLGANHALPDLIDKLAATERLYLLLTRSAETPYELTAKALLDKVNLREMLTHRMQQFEVMEAYGSSNRAELLWEPGSRMWIAEVTHVGKRGAE